MPRKNAAQKATAAKKAAPAKTAAKTATTKAETTETVDQTERVDAHLVTETGHAGAVGGTKEGPAFDNFDVSDPR